MSSYKGNFVKPSYAVRVRCRKGTSRLIKLACTPVWSVEDQMLVMPPSLTLVGEVRRLNTAGYMMK